MNKTNTSIWQAPGYLATIISVACSFSGWAMLLPVLPFAVLAAGGSATVAGATTGIFMVFSVLTQLVTPILLRRVGYRQVMIWASLLLGVPAFGHIASMDTVPVLFICALRGIGFGAVCVAESALIAELLPVTQVGRGAAFLGVAIGLPQALLLPSGLTIAHLVGTTLVYVLAAAVAVGAAVCAVFIPAIYPADRTPGDAHLGRVLAVTALPAAAICVAAFSFSGLSAFLPASLSANAVASAAVWGGALLGVSGASQMVARFAAGIVADRSGPGRLTLPGLVSAVVGLTAIVVAVWRGQSADADQVNLMLILVGVGVLVHGLGYGAIQNESLLLMYKRLPHSQIATGSTVWNAAFDGGNGAGALVLGVVVAGSGYLTGFTLSLALVACVLVISVAAVIMKR